MSKKTGLVLTGGGARAAYQAGAVRAIYEIIGKDKNLFEVVTGNSAGAINATYLSANTENWNVSTTNLIDLWTRVKPQNIFDLRKRTITDLGLKWASGTVFGGLTPKGSTVNHLLDTEPLRELALREVDFEHIKKNIDEGNLHGMALSSTNYNTGTSVIFYDGHDSIKDWVRSDRFSMRTNINVEHLMASSAIPFFFPPVQVGNSFYGDGCIRQSTPLSPAIHLGADKIIGIGVRYAQPKDMIRELTFEPFPHPTFGQVTGIMLNALFLDSLDADVERLKRINNLIAEGAHPELKTVPILMIRPSRDLGKMTVKISHELPLMLRYLLKGIGVSDSEGLDVLSYLAFDESYTKPLIELGYEDAYNMKDEIRRFSDDA